MFCRYERKIALAALVLVAAFRGHMLFSESGSDDEDYLPSTPGEIRSEIKHKHCREDLHFLCRASNCGTSNLFFSLTRYAKGIPDQCSRRTVVAPSPQKIVQRQVYERLEPLEDTCFQSGTYEWCYDRASRGRLYNNSTGIKVEYQLTGNLIGSPDVRWESFEYSGWDILLEGGYPNFTTSHFYEYRPTDETDSLRAAVKLTLGCCHDKEAKGALASLKVDHKTAPADEFGRHSIVESSLCTDLLCPRSLSDDKNKVLQEYTHTFVMVLLSRVILDAWRTFSSCHKATRDPYAVSSTEYVNSASRLARLLSKSIVNAFRVDEDEEVVGDGEDDVALAFDIRNVKGDILRVVKKGEFSKAQLLNMTSLAIDDAVALGSRSNNLRQSLLKVLASELTSAIAELREADLYGAHALRSSLLQQPYGGKSLTGETNDDQCLWTNYQSQSLVSAECSGALEFAPAKLERLRSAEFQEFSVAMRDILLGCICLVLLVAWARKRAYERGGCLDLYAKSKKARKRMQLRAALADPVLRRDMELKAIKAAGPQGGALAMQKLDEIASQNHAEDEKKDADGQGPDIPSHRRVFIFLYFFGCVVYFGDEIDFSTFVDFNILMLVGFLVSFPSGSKEFGSKRDSLQMPLLGQGTHADERGVEIPIV